MNCRTAMIAVRPSWPSPALRRASASDRWARINAVAALVWLGALGLAAPASAEIPLSERKSGYEFTQHTRIKEARLIDGINLGGEASHQTQQIFQLALREEIGDQQHIKG